MNKSILKKIIYFTLIIALLAFLLFNEYGLIKYFQLQNQVSNLREEIKQTDTELEELSREIDSVKTNLFKIEKIARERYRMLDKNEQAIKIEKHSDN